MSIRVATMPEPVRQRRALTLAGAACAVLLTVAAACGTAGGTPVAGGTAEQTSASSPTGASNTVSTVPLGPAPSPSASAAGSASAAPADSASASSSGSASAASVDGASAASSGASTTTHSETGSTTTSAGVPAGTSSQHPGQVDAADYADRLIRAWGSGDRPTASTYATSAVIDTLFARSDPGGPDWNRTKVDGTAGTIYVTYTDTENGETLTVGVSDIILSQGQGHAVHSATFSGTHNFNHTSVTYVTPFAADGTLRLPVTTGGGGVEATGCQQSLVGGPGVFGCGATAEGLVACWRDAAKSTAMYCMTGPTDKQVKKVEDPTAHARPPYQPEPWVVHLNDGSVCQARIGGAWGTPPIPNSAYTYGCSGGSFSALVSIGSKPTMDRSGPLWIATAIKAGAAGTSAHPSDQVIIMWAVFAGKGPA